MAWIGWVIGHEFNFTVNIWEQSTKTEQQVFPNKILSVRILNKTHLNKTPSEAIFLYDFESTVDILEGIKRQQS